MFDIGSAAILHWPSLHEPIQLDKLWKATWDPCCDCQATENAFVAWGVYDGRLAVTIITTDPRKTSGSKLANICRVAPFTDRYDLAIEMFDNGVCVRYRTGEKEFRQCVFRLKEWDWIEPHTHQQ